MNYNEYNPNTKKIKLFILISFLIFSFILEQFYNNYLFSKSLIIEEYLFKTTPNYIITFFKIITKFGSQTIIIPLIIIIFFTFPLNISYLFINIIMLVCYFNGILKIFYLNPRPFWLKNEIKINCECSYGNPSGHSFMCFAIYLSLWKVCTNFDYFKKDFKGKIIKKIFLVVIILFCFFILISRIYLNVHSINQIIYGSSLGISLFFYYFYVLKFNEMNGKNFFDYIRNKKNIKLKSIKFLFYLILLFLICFFKNDTEIKNKYNENLLKICPKTKEFKKFKNDGILNGLSIFFIIGVHYGLYFFLNKILIYKPYKDDEINNWNIGGNKIGFIKKIIILIPMMLPMILFLIVPDVSKKNNFSNLFVVFTLKVAVPYFLTGFCMFGVYIYIIVKLKIGYVKIYDNFRFGTEADNSNYFPKEKDVNISAHDTKEKENKI
jgi:membrane-associated phospholipid phosphatase